MSNSTDGGVRVEANLQEQRALETKMLLKRQVLKSFHLFSLALTVSNNKISNCLA